MRILLAHLDQVWEDKNANKAKVFASLHLAKVNGADLVIFPEMTLVGFSMNTEITATSVDSSDQDFFSNASKKYGVAIIAGGVSHSIGSGYHNLAWFFDADGVQLFEYGKTHMFGYGGESTAHSPSDSCNTFEWKNSSWGLGICYDLRFAIHALALAKNNAKNLIYIANWPCSRGDHWKSLIKARAIETQCNVIGVDRIGVDGAGLDYGSSMSCAFGPSGEEYTLEPINEENSLLNMDENSGEYYRKTFNTIRDQRWDLYKEWLHA